MSKPDTGVNADLNGAVAFNADSEWNERVDFAPLVRNSAKIIKEISPDTGLHPDFGSGLWDGQPIGIPYIVVPEGETLTKFVDTLWPNEGDKGPFPIPPDAPVEGGGDRHVIVVQLDSSAPNGLGKLYELYNAHWNGHAWTGQSAVFDLQGGDHQRPDGWTSADAAGLPIFPGLVRYDDVKNAVADDATLGHALRFTLSQALTAMKAVGAASHWADDIDGPAPFGMHVRLRADFPVPADASPEVKVIINTLKEYGMILADNGSDWYVSGTPDKHWDNDALHVLGQVQGGDFQVVDNSKIGVVYIGHETSDTIDGNDRRNTMFGDAGHDRISGEGGKDRLTGWTGDDVLSGGGQSDTFVFQQHWGKSARTENLGNDEITDFTAKGSQHDVIAIDKAFGIQSFDQLLDATQAHDGDAMIRLNGHSSITLDGVDPAGLSAKDFHFV